MADESEITGIFASDIILRTGILAAIRDLREQPHLLKFVFASLIQDDETNKIYGQKEVDRATEWFQKTNIPVVMDFRFGDGAEANMITISLIESNEAENTLADLHYEPYIDQEAPWPALSASFTPVGYDPGSGNLQLPTATGDALVITTGMLLADAAGGLHPILNVLDRYNIVTESNLNADLRGATIKGIKPRYITQLESLHFKESYRIGVHCHGAPEHLLWLHSIVVWALLRSKQRYFEARGFERSTIASSAFTQAETNKPEKYFQRFISITGYVRQIWVKDSVERIESADYGLLYSKVGSIATEFGPEPGQLDPAWEAEIEGYDSFGASTDE